MPKKYKKYSSKTYVYAIFFTQAVSEFPQTKQSCPQLEFFLHFCNREKSKMIILSRNVLQLIYYLPPAKIKKLPENIHQILGKLQTESNNNQKLENLIYSPGGGTPNMRQT